MKVFFAKCLTVLLALFIAGLAIGLPRAVVTRMFKQAVTRPEISATQSPVDQVLDHVLFTAENFFESSATATARLIVGLPPHTPDIFYLQDMQM